MQRFKKAAKDVATYVVTWICYFAYKYRNSCSRFTFLERVIVHYNNTKFYCNFYKNFTESIFPRIFIKVPLLFSILFKIFELK